MKQQVLNHMQALRLNTVDLNFMQRLAKQLEDTKEHSLDTVSLGDVERSMLETYGTTYDVTEESSLEPLVARVRAIQKGAK